MSTKIEWTDETWNFLGGCSPVSEGCKHCAAARLAAGRLKNHPLYKGLTENGRWTGKVRLCTDIGRTDILEKPLHWREPRMIFPCFMGDLFHPSVPFEFIHQVFNVTQKAYWHTYQILTKRPDVALEFIKTCATHDGNGNKNIFDGARFHCLLAWPLPNVWLGVSISTQEDADKNIPILLQIPAAARFVSIEPILEGIWLNPIHFHYKGGIHQVIVGGESGSGARPMHPDWARAIRDQCIASGVPFFFKQWGAWLDSQQFSPTAPDKMIGYRGHNWGDGHTTYKVGKKKAGRLLDRREWNEFPKGGAKDER